MKILDVQPFHEGIQRNIVMLQRLCDEMEAIRKATDGLVAMDDSLKGEGGNAIRSFYEECHLPFMLFFDATNKEFIDKLRLMTNALEALEPHPEGYIKEEFLKGAVEEGLVEIANLTESLTDESNEIMDRVADIVALPHLDDSDVQTGVKRAKVRRDETITQLGAFDAEQTNALTSVEADFNEMETWLTDLEGLFKEGLTDVDFPAEMWAEYAATSPLKIALETDSADVEKVAEGETPEEVENEITTKKTPPEIMADLSRNLNHGIPGTQSSFAMFMAGRKDGLSIKREKGGTYRVNATENALNRLQVKIDKDARSALDKKKRNKGQVKPHWSKETRLKYLKMAPLNYAEEGKQIWSKAGQNAIKNFPEVEYWAKQGTRTEKAKMVGKATLIGTKDSFKEIVDVKGIVKNKNLKGLGKALGPVGAGLSYYNNYEAAKAAGLSGKKAAITATVDTVIDTAVAGAIQAASIAFFTAAIPIPGVGTAAGVAVGIFANNLLNGKSKKTGKTGMDKIKGGIKSLFK